jgi:uncharacterized protein
MSRLKLLSWNPDENRLRGLLRIGIVAALIILIILILDAVYLVVQSDLNTFPGSSIVLTSPADDNYFYVFNALITLTGIVSSVWLGGKWLDHRSLPGFGFHLKSSWFKHLFFGLILGAVLMAGIFLFELAAGWISITGLMNQQNQPGSFFVEIFKALLIFLSVGIYEELFFRGYLLRNLAESFNFPKFGARFSLILAWLISSVIFGFLHFDNPHATFISTFNIFLAGIFLGLGYMLTGELAISIGLHISWNFFQGFIFGFPVSGGILTSSFFQIQQAGPRFLTGGNFGPEAGLIGNAAILIGCVFIVLWLKKQGDHFGVKEELAVFQKPDRVSNSQDDKVK